VTSTERALTAVHLHEAGKHWLIIKVNTLFLGRKADAALTPQSNPRLTQS
jgi:hypothetical protein